MKMMKLIILLGTIALMLSGCSKPLDPAEAAEYEDEYKRTLLEVTRLETALKTEAVAGKVALMMEDLHASRKRSDELYDLLIDRSPGSVSRARTQASREQRELDTLAVEAVLSSIPEPVKPISLEELEAGLPNN